MAGARLLQRGAREGGIAAGRAAALCLHLRGAPLALGHIKVALRIIERGLADKPFGMQFLIALHHAPQLPHIGFALQHALLRHRQSDFTHLTHTRLGLRHACCRLRQRRALILVFEHDQALPACDALPLAYRHLRHAARDFNADGGALRCHHAPACHHGLHQIAAHRLQCFHRAAEQRIASQQGSGHHCHRGQQRRFAPAGTEQSN